jgi:hypothetical protein
MKKLGLLEVSLFKLVVSGSTIRTLLEQTWLTRSFKRKNPAPGATAPTVQTVGRLRVPPAPNRLGTWAYGHVTSRVGKWWLNRLKTVSTDSRAPTRGHM